MEHTYIPKSWWATPIVQVRNTGVEEMNKGLARIIMDKEAEVRKGVPTPVAGLTEGLSTHWLEFNVLNWPNPECVQLRALVLAGAREFFKLIGDPEDPSFKICGISCWANILRHGESLDIHHHDPGFVSAHYTVQTGRENGATEPNSRDSGHTVYYRPGFIDRSQGVGIETSPWDLDWKISNPPTAGNMIFFPSYVRHEVRPNLEKHERISIAMDIYVKRQNAMIHFGGPRWFVPK